MNPQSLQFPLGFPQAQQQNFNAGVQSGGVPGQMGMPTASDPNNVGAQVQNAAQILQVSVR